MTTTTLPTHPLSTDDPIFSIEHIAALFRVSVYTEREYTCRDDFPAAHKLGARLPGTAKIPWRGSSVCRGRLHPSADESPRPPRPSRRPGPTTPSTRAKPVSVVGLVNNLSPAGASPYYGLTWVEPDGRPAQTSAGKTLLVAMAKATAGRDLQRGTGPQGMTPPGPHHGRVPVHPRRPQP